MIDEVEIPAYLTTAEVAEANKMSTRKARRKLMRAGILERDGTRDWHVAESRLRERLPDMYDRVYAWFASRPPRATGGHQEPARAMWQRPTTE